MRLHVANTEHIAQEVLNFDLDMGLIEGEYAHPDLHIEPWLPDELVVFCAPDHPYAQLTQLDDEQLLAARWILREEGSGTRQTFDRAMHGILAELDIQFELEHTEAIKRSVEAGLGIGCLSRITLADAFSRGSLVPLAVPHRDMHRQFHFVTHNKKFKTRALSAWIDCCRAQYLPD